jgi:hypothetical protein
MQVTCRVSTGGTSRPVQLTSDFLGESRHGFVAKMAYRLWAQRVRPLGSPDVGAADKEGNVYVPTANGTFDASSGGRDYGDSVLKLTLDGSSILIRDYFTPYDQARLSEADADLGSSGPTLLPDQVAPHPHLLLRPTR